MLYIYINNNVCFCFSDIENKAVEVLPRQQKKSESSPVNFEHSSAKPDIVLDIKQAHHDSSDESSIDSRYTAKSSAAISGKSDIHIADNILGSPHPHKHKCETYVPVNSPNLITPKKTASQKPESRFDPETLALIREIGSALLNSPAKAELEEQVDSDLKEGESLVNHYVRKIEKTVKVPTSKPKVRRIVIIDKDDKDTCSDKSRSFSPVTPTSDSDAKPVTSKWSPVSRKQTFSPPSDRSKSQTADDKPVSPKWCAVSSSQSSSSPKTISDCDEKTAADAKIINSKSPSKMASDSKEKESTQETCSVKDLRGKFELPDLGAGKITPNQSPLLNTPPSAGARLEHHNIELSPSSVAVTLKGQHSHDEESKYQYLSKSPKQQRHSEPEIVLNMDSVRMFEGKLKNMGDPFVISSVKEKSELESSDVQLRDKTDQSKSGGRPKSASSARGQGRSFQGQSSRSLGANSGRGFLQQSQSMLETDTQEEPFSWDGKKVRKSYGKSHPLAKLENRQYMESARKNPFYSTM